MDFRAFIATWLDPISVLVGLIISVPVIWTWYDVVWGRRRLYRRWFKESCREVGKRPAILVMDLLSGKDISAQVSHYLASSVPDIDAAVPEDRRFKVVRNHTLKPEDMPDLVREIRACAARIGYAGCDIVHCFYAGPCMPAALVGAEFANSARCLFYQYQNGDYQNWGPLRHMLD